MSGLFSQQSPARYARSLERHSDAMIAAANTNGRALPSDTTPYNFGLGAFLSLFAIPLAIAAAVLVGLLGFGIGGILGAFGMLTAFQLFALGSRQTITRGRDFMFALVVGTIATVLGALAGLLSDLFSTFVARGGTTGIIEDILMGRAEFPFPIQAEYIAVPLIVAAVLAILVIVMNGAKALAAHRESIIAKANAAATSATTRLETSRQALSSSATNSANAANKFANHVMTINASSPGIILNGKPLDEQEITKGFSSKLSDLAHKAIRAWSGLRTER
ncbi:hypothetical protein CLV85_0641 [Salinibacterium amurskyense]|uniref:Uncharacterized protein n=1 Tax=Salinibacterium amurskyense TaxID=205941 RepID=A0A2M9D6X6_9MICO|nr:hypothetical protein [Salinibacterium amurskyense]PJJ81464.1 hypothetical protein CLV85_0641 [Salinibacterium amurskyense]GHD80405.1 hypothetical protein GCM10007394_11730 [Salinibacterium amurskyense]